MYCIKITKHIVYTLREIFININELKSSTFNTIVRIISTDILIKKKINNTNDELALLQILVADDTGCINAIFNDNFIKFVNIGREIIIRNVKIEIINGHVILICDENCILFESNNLITDFSNCLEKNYSKIKLNKLEKNIF